MTLATSLCNVVLCIMRSLHVLKMVQRGIQRANDSLYERKELEQPFKKVDKKTTGLLTTGLSTTGLLTTILVTICLLTTGLLTIGLLITELVTIGFFGSWSFGLLFDN